MGLSFWTIQDWVVKVGIWVLERLENAFRAGFGSKTAGKCMLDLVCYFPKAEISGLSPDY